MPTKEPVKKVAARARKAAAATRKRAAAPAAPPHELVAERAYFLHLETGRDALANWLQAERELAAA